MQFTKFFNELKRRNVVRVATVYAITAWLVIQIIDTVFPILALPEWTVTLLTVLILIGFPFALIFAWAFEMTPEGLKRSEDVDEERSITDQTGKKINKFIIASLSLIIVFLVTERIFFAGSGASQADAGIAAEASIAVLPFVNMSADPDNEYFSDGLSEELLNSLAQEENLKVAGRTSSFKFKDVNDDLRTIGQELGVDHILEGSVRKSGENIRITVQLIKTDDGYHMWSETYDRQLSDIFEIQDEISRKVLDELRVRLLDEDGSPEPEIPTQNLEAYQIYLRANHLMLDRQIEKMQTAIGLYEDAVSLDPFFAEAYARLAIAHHLMGFYGAADFGEAQVKLKEYSERALSLNNELGTAYAGLGLFYSTIDQEQSTEYYLQSLGLNDNQPDVYNWLGNNYTTQGEFSLRDEAYINAYELDRLAPLSMYNRARVHTDQGELDEAEALLRKNLRLNPGFTQSMRLIGLIVLEREGRFDEAMITVHEWMETNSYNAIHMFDMVLYAFELDMPELVFEYQARIASELPQSREVAISTSLYALLRENPDLFENSLLSFVEQFNITVPEPEFYGSLYGYVEIGGDPERAIAQFRKYDPSLLSDTLSIISPLGYQVAAPLLGILYHMNDQEQLKRLNDAYCNYGKQLETTGTTGLGYRRFIRNRMLCHLFEGETDRAYPFFRTYYTELSPIFFDYFILQNSVVFMDAMNDPRFAEIRDEIRASMENQRESLRRYFSNLEQN
ncbi:hypothetical protein [Rhodohalobacter mucosus]|uniref:Uncharacterized protein n=1 Tax=Rhodohalobacter mucosus TaxID=2079485 RepID=A0A316TNZ2_9BACT|nr:hypothetical protein [Rhodohalobacter mucosus]PWN05498.1 hypothetical protein DDZ15_12890 [Rhodohalobacter mucosus]